jgi:hypothetical protein
MGRACPRRCGRAVAWVGPGLAALVAVTLGAAPPALAASAAKAPAARPAATVKDVPALYEQAQKLYKAGAYAEALPLYEKVFALKPIPEASYGIARCHHQLGHIEEAAAAYERFLASAPGHEGAAKARAYLVEVEATLAATALETLDYAGARAAYDRALEVYASIDPARADATTGALLVGLADALSGLTLHADAVLALKKALATAAVPEVRKRAEKLLARLDPAFARAAAPASLPAAGGGRHGRLGLWLGLGGGAVVVAGAAVVLTVLLATRGARTPVTDLGIYDAPFGGQ